jgi:hypothetical protein
MVRVNVKVAVVTGVPLAVLTAFFEAWARDGTRLDFWLAFALTAILCAIILGVPQGYLASLLALRRGWRLTGLLAAVFMARVTGSNVVFVAAASLRAVLPPPGQWSPVQGPPGKATALLGPTCHIYANPREKFYVRADGGQLYGYHDHGLLHWDDDLWLVLNRLVFGDPVLVVERAGTWTTVDAVPPERLHSDCTTLGGSRTPPAPRGEVSRLVIHIKISDCLVEDQFILSADGSIWQWETGGCANQVDFSRSALEVLSVIVSFFAYLFVAIGGRLRTAASA